MCAQAHSSATGNHPIHNVHVEVCCSCMYHFISPPPLPSIVLNALWNPCGWCSCDMFIFRTCASRVLHSLSTALCIYYIWLTFILAKQNDGTSDVEGPEEGDSLSDVVGPEEGDGPSDIEGPEEGDGPSDVVGPEEGDGPSDVEGPEEDDGLQMLKGQKMMMDFRCGMVRRR